MPDRANHAIRDGDLPIVYIAGDKGLYKFFVDSGEIAMMKAVAEGGSELGYMVGYGALTRKEMPIPVNIELVFSPSIPQGQSSSSLNNAFYHYKPDGTVTVRAAPISGKRWRGVSVNKYNPDKWLAWYMNASGDSEVYLSVDAGVTWTRVILSNRTNYNAHLITKVEWSPHAPDFAWITGITAGGSSSSLALWYGDPAASMVRFDPYTDNRSNAAWYYSVVLNNGSIIARGRTGGFSKIYWRITVEPTGNVVHNSNSSAFGGWVTANSGVNLPDSTAVIVANFDPNNTGNRNLFFTSNYLVSEPIDTGQVSGSTSIAGIADGHVYLGNNGQGIIEVNTPFTAPTIGAVVYNGAIDGVQSDDQTKTVIAGAANRTGPGLTVAIKSGTEWEELALGTLIPFGWANTGAGGFAVIKRTS